MKNRTKLFAKNTTFGAIQQIFVFLSGLVVPNIMLRYYGSEINGAVSSVTQLVSYVSLIEAGMSGSMIYYLYKPLAHNDYKGVNSIVSASKKSYQKIGIIFIIISTLLATVYSFTVSAGGLTRIDIFLLTFFIGLSGALEYITLSKYRVLFTADQKNYIISLATTLHTVLHIGVVIICAICGLSVVALKAVSILTVFARSLVLHLYLKSKYKWVTFKEKPDYTSLSKRWDAFYMQVLWAMQSGAPIMIATYLTDMVSVSIYSIYNLIITGINNISSIFLSGLQSAFGEIIVGDDKEKLSNIYNQFSFAFYGIISVIFSIAAVMIMPFINVYTKGIEDGALYYDVFLGILFVVNGLLYSLKTPQGMMVIAAGHYRETRWQTTIQALLLLLFGIVFAGPLNMGIKGIVFAAIISNGYRLIDLICYVGKRIVSKSIFETVKNIIFCLIHIIAISLIFKMIKIESGNYLLWILDAVIVGVFSVVLLLIRWAVFDRKNLSTFFLRVKLLFKRGR